MTSRNVYSNETRKENIQQGVTEKPSSSKVKSISNTEKSTSCAFNEKESQKFKST